MASGAAGCARCKLRLHHQPVGEVEEQRGAVAQAQFRGRQFQELQLRRGHPDPLQDPGQALPLGPGVEAHRRAHGAGDAGQKLEPGKTEPGRGLGQPGQRHPGPGPQGVAVALKPWRLFARCSVSPGSPASSMSTFDPRPRKNNGQPRSWARRISPQTSSKSAGAANRAATPPIRQVVRGARGWFSKKQNFLHRIKVKLKDDHLFYAANTLSLILALSLLLHASTFSEASSFASSSGFFGTISGQGSLLVTN